MTHSNYKITCVGIDNKGQLAKVSSFVYNAESVNEAMREVKKSRIRKKLLKVNNIDPKTTDFVIVQCDEKGNTLTDEVETERIEVQRLIDDVLSEKGEFFDE